MAANHQVCFVHLLANLTQKALIELTAHTHTLLRCRPLFYKSAKVHVRCDSNHMPSKTLNEKPHEEEEKHSERKKRKKQMCRERRERKDSTDRADGLFTITCEAIHTQKKPTT